MDNLDVLINNAKILDKEDEKRLLLETFKPFALSLHTLNKQAKKYRDIGKEIERKENDFSHKSETANAIFKINKNAFKNSTTTTISGIEIDYTKKETYTPLIEKVIDKCKHPFFLVFTISSLNHSGIITDDLKDDYIKNILSFIDKYVSAKGPWKENINLLPEFNENSIRKIIENASTFIPPFIKSDDAKKYFKEKDDLYAKKRYLFKTTLRFRTSCNRNKLFQNAFWKNL